MGTVRNRDFGAVIGVGGIGSQAHATGIAGQINWIGIGPHKAEAKKKRGPKITFDHFVNFGSDGPEFRKLAPMLAQRMYSRNARHVMKDLSEDEYREATNILELAMDAPPSRPRAVRSRRTGSCCRRTPKRRVPRCT
jgi:hypothetical protein